MSDADIVRQAIGVDLLEVDAGEALAALARMETDLDWYGFHLDKYEKDYGELANERDRLRAEVERLRAALDEEREALVESATMVGERDNEVERLRELFHRNTDGTWIFNETYDGRWILVSDFARQALDK